MAVELIVNGHALQQQEFTADGTMRDVAFTQHIPHSSWVALRITASAHTNPVYVLVDGEPIRASRRSAQWCRAAVDRCWKMKAPQIREEEQAAAQAAYDHARQAYDAIIGEAIDDTE